MHRFWCLIALACCCSACQNSADKHRHNHSPHADEAHFFSGYYSINGSVMLFEDAATGRKYNVFDDEPAKSVERAYNKLIDHSKERVYLEVSGYLRDKFHHDDPHSRTLIITDLKTLKPIQGHNSQHLAGNYYCIFPNEKNPKKHYTLILNTDYSFQWRMSSLLGETLQCSDGFWCRKDATTCILEGSYPDGCTNSMIGLVDLRQGLFMISDEQGHNYVFKVDHYFRPE